jgi:hypothetical protein
LLTNLQTDKFQIKLPKTTAPNTIPPQPSSHQPTTFVAKGEILADALTAVF